MTKNPSYINNLSKSKPVLSETIDPIERLINMQEESAQIKRAIAMQEFTQKQTEQRISTAIEIAKLSVSVAMNKALAGSIK